MKFVFSSRSYALFPWDYFVSSIGTGSSKYIDLFGGTPHIWIDHIGQVIPEEISDSKSNIVLYTPKPYNYSFCAPEGIQCDRTQAYYRNCVDVMVRLGIHNMAVTVGGGLVDIPRDLRHRQAVNQLKSLADYAKANSVSINIESYGSEIDSEAYDLNSICSLVNEIAMDNVFALPDLGRIKNTDQINSIFNRMNGKIGFVKLRDYSESEEMPIGKGNMPIEEYIVQLEKIGFDGYICVDLTNDDYWDTPDMHDAEAANVIRRSLERRK